MTERRKEDGGCPKRPYVKPEIKQVQLKPEEAVLGGCKTTTNAGPARITCDFGVGNCRAMGTS
jgi:hypothetical protein